MESYELMKEIQEFVKTKGWRLVDWDFKDTLEDMNEYQIWVQPIKTDEED